MRFHVGLMLYIILWPTYPFCLALIIPFRNQDRFLLFHYHTSHFVRIKMLMTPAKALAILAFASTTLAGYHNDYYENDVSNYAPARQQYRGNSKHAAAYQKHLRQQQLEAREALEEEYLDDMFDFIARQAPVAAPPAAKPAATSTTSASSTTSTTSSTTSTSATTSASATPNNQANTDALKQKITQNHKHKHEHREKIKKDKEHLHHAEARLKHYHQRKKELEGHIKKHEEHIKKLEEEEKKMKEGQSQLPKRWLDDLFSEWEF